MSRFVFSTLYNESAEYLEFFVQNFLNFTGNESVLFVNVSQSSPALIDRDFGPRVHLLRGKISRAAWGATLLAGHMECFGAASEAYSDFEWFITMASNSLFFRPFNPELVVEAVGAAVRSEKAAVDWDNLPDNWHWPKMRKHRAVGEVLQQRWKIAGLDGGQIEGRIARRSDWSILDAIQADIFNEWIGLDAPLEEILPVTVFNALGSGLSCNICRVHWGRPEQNGGRFTQIWELMDPASLPPQFCMMKWFQRDTLCPETLAVCTPLGRDLLTALQSAAAEPLRRLEIETLLRGIISGFERLQPPIPLAISGLPAGGPVFQLGMIAANRQICALDGGSMLPGQSYLYFESSGAMLSLNIAVEAENRLALRCDLIAVPDAGPMPEPSLQCYIYLAMPTERSVRLRLQGKLSGIAPDQFLSRITWHSGGRYPVQKPLFQTVSAADFTADYMCPQSVGQSHIGLPVYAGQNMVVSLSEVAGG